MPLKDKKANAALAARARAAKVAPPVQVAEPPAIAIPNRRGRRRRRKKGDRLIYKAIVLYKTSMSYPQIWKLMRDGKFPRSVRLGSRAAWWESEVDAWLDSLKRTTFAGDAP
jgi:prophage regulatory protein